MNIKEANIAAFTYQRDMEKKNSELQNAISIKLAQVIDSNEVRLLKPFIKKTTIKELNDYKLLSHITNESSKHIYGYEKISCMEYAIKKRKDAIFDILLEYMLPHAFMEEQQRWLYIAILHGTEAMVELLAKQKISLTDEDYDRLSKMDNKDVLDRLEHYLVSDILNDSNILPHEADKEESSFKWQAFLETARCGKDYHCRKSTNL